MYLRTIVLHRFSHVLDLEILELSLESWLVYNPCIFPGSQPAVLLRLCPGTNHLAEAED